MDVKSFYRQMADYARWKQSLSVQLRQCQQWFSDFQSDSKAASHCLQQALSLLENDSFTVACVGEFSRGKTELINALLFTEYGSRLLPSKPGRTTMCPTEIYFDPDDQPNCVRLLPIETRRTTTSLNNFKRIPNNWVSVTFDAKDPISIARAMSHISEVKKVSGADAKAMGFDPQQLTKSVDGQLEVPTWRHALVNLKHPLLQHGLRILDTPGLNALGNEPELTLSTLQQADAVIFLLAADSGLSYTDVSIWQDYLRDLRSNHHNGGNTIALLNKVDALWDDLGEPSEIEQNIHAVREATARLLGQPMEHVVAISAKQGLLARAAHDTQLLRRSNLPELESLLAQQLIQNQQSMIGQRIIADAINIMQNTRKQLKEQLYQADFELESLQQQLNHPEKFQSLVKGLRSDVRQRHQKYHRQSLDLRSFQRLIDQHYRVLQGPLAPVQLEGLINTTHQQMVKSWSFIGLGQSIETFFVELRQRFARIDDELKASNATLLDIYQRARYHSCSNTDANNHCLDIRSHRLRLEQLERQAQQFRRSMGNIFNLKQRVIGRFINSLVQEVRLLNGRLQDDLDAWVKEALAPMSHQTHYQKLLLEKQMLQITNLNQQQDGQLNRLQELSSLIAEQEAALFSLDQILGSVQIGAPALAATLAVNSQRSAAEQSLQLDRV